MSEAGTARPPSRGGLTAYARSPRRRIRFVTVASQINGNIEPVDSAVASTKLDRSNDGQVHTFSLYALSVGRLARRKMLTGFGSILHPPRIPHLAPDAISVHRPSHRSS